MKAVIIGSGNAATVLGRLILQKDGTILQVVSRHLHHAESLAVQLNADFGDLTEKINPNADIYIIAVADDAIDAVLNQFSFNNKLVVHVAGAASIHLLKNASENYGVLYPLQSLRKEIQQIPEIPFLVDANNSFALDRIKEIAMQLSPIVHIANDEARNLLHVAAVFVNNFTNHLYSQAADFCKNENIDFDLLKPLIIETASRLRYTHPTHLQTGPAKRNDIKTIQQHQAILEKYGNLLELYKTFTKSIQSFNDRG
jgi:hypothetical protein